MIVLMSDFGIKDPYVGIMKGVIKTVCPQAEIVDLTHDIPPQDIHAALFILKNSYTHFPRGTTFTAVIDPGVGGKRYPVAIKTADYHFVGPDNGIFSFLFEEKGEAQSIIHLNKAEYYYIKQPDSTFHGRDIFAPVAAHIEKGTPFHKLGIPLQEVTQIKIPAQQRTSQGLRIPLAHIDHFGNLIFALSRNQWAQLTRQHGITIFYKEFEISVLSSNYESDHPLIALFNSYGLLELASPRGNAAKLTKTTTTRQAYLDLRYLP